MELTCIVVARNNAANTNADAKIGDFWMREEAKEHHLDEDALDTT